MRRTCLNFGLAYALTLLLSILALGLVVDRTGLGQETGWTLILVVPLLAASVFSARRDARQHGTLRSSRELWWIAVASGCTALCLIAFLLVAAVAMLQVAISEGADMVVFTGPLGVGAVLFSLVSFLTAAVLIIRMTFATILRRTLRSMDRKDRDTF